VTGNKEHDLQKGQVWARDLSVTGSNPGSFFRFGNPKTFSSCIVLFERETGSKAIRSLSHPPIDRTNRNLDWKSRRAFVC